MEIDDSVLLKPLTDADFFMNHSLVVRLIAENADKQVVRRKLEILLGRRTKSTEYKEVEREFYDTYRELYDKTVQLAADTKYNGDISRVKYTDTLSCDGVDELEEEYDQKIELLKQKADRVGLFYDDIINETSEEFINRFY